MINVVGAKLMTANLRERTLQGADLTQLPKMAALLQVISRMFLGIIPSGILDEMNAYNRKWFAGLPYLEEARKDTRDANEVFNRSLSKTICQVPIPHSTRMIMPKALPFFAFEADDPALEHADTYCATRTREEWIPLMDYRDVLVTGQRRAVTVDLLLSNKEALARIK